MAPPFNYRRLRQLPAPSRRSSDALNPKPIPLNPEPGTPLSFSKVGAADYNFYSVEASTGQVPLLTPFYAEPVAYTVAYTV